MAIDRGNAINCAGLVEVGGLRNIYVTELESLTAVTKDATSDTHAYTHLTVSGCAMFQLKPNTASWNSTSTKENGITVFETTLSWYIPNINSSRLEVLQSMTDKCIVAVAEMYSGTSMTVGISDEYQGTGHGTTDYIYNKTYGVMTVESTSGTDFGDGNGATVTITARSFEQPRAYTGAIMQNAGNATADLA